VDNPGRYGLQDRLLQLGRLTRELHRLRDLAIAVYRYGILGTEGEERVRALLREQGVPETWIEVLRTVALLG